MRVSDIIRFYSNKDIRDRILEFSKNREIMIRYKDKVGPRPDILMFDNDILESVKKGATSFHSSIERWSNPLFLKDIKSKKELDNLRIGWDFIIDIDCPYVEYSKICANLLCEALEFHGVKNYSIKFSGGSGFHLGVPFESFPNEITGVNIKFAFPDAARIVAEYLRQMIKKHLADSLLEMHSLTEIGKNVGKSAGDLIQKEDFDPFSVISIDTIAISSRHMIRMPYTFNEKKWLISIPIKRKDILSFNPIKDANPLSITTELGFLNTSSKDEARQLFLQAFDWNKKMLSTKIESISKTEVPKKAIKEEFFPPCIKLLLKGVEDGRKRGVFILINFLRSCGWDINSIESKLKEWNLKNKEPLPENYINSQINWHKQIQGSYLPPGCDNQGYLKDIGICKPDEICKLIKNPAAYPFKVMKRRWKNGE